MPDGTPEHATHAHDDECRALFREWQRYDLVADDTEGRFHPDDIAIAARQRAMFARQLRALGCSPEVLVALAGEDENG
ncbi:MAG: hypothetical protein O2798_00715 [Chloroflexi bacterium]|nr:hypothetical protein [Chloroflexota bacterium]MDA1239344.1 hypothetical protein [Chloroflexota bacterium]